MQVITDVGLNATERADQGGFLINIASFAVTETSPDALPTDDSLAGTAVYSGQIDLIEALDSATVKFTCTIPAEVPTTGTWSLKEAGLYLDDGTLFSHGKLEPAYDKTNDFGITFYIFVTLARLGDVINITIGTEVGIPSTPFVRTIPKTTDSYQNTLAVLDEWQNPDGTNSPSLAIKYGPGSKFWGYVGFDRIYNGFVSGIDAAHGFTLSPDDIGFTIETGEHVIVHEVNGGSYRSHKYEYIGNSKWILLDGTPTFSATTAVAIWKRTMPIAGTTAHVEILVDTFTVDEANGTHTLPFTVDQRGKALCWIGTLFQENAISGSTVSWSGLPVGVTGKVVYFQSSEPDDTHPATNVVINQYEFAHQYDSVLSLTEIPADRNHVMVFKSGLFVPDSNWALLGSDVSLTNGESANGETFVVVVVKTNAVKAKAFYVYDRTSYPTGSNDIYVAGLNPKPTLLFAGGLLQAPSTYTVSSNHIVTDEVLGTDVRLDVRQLFSAAANYYFLTRREGQGLVKTVDKVGAGILTVTQVDGETYDIALGPEIFGIPDQALTYNAVPYGMNNCLAGEHVTVEIKLGGSDYSSVTKAADQNGYWADIFYPQTAGTYVFKLKAMSSGTQFTRQVEVLAETINPVITDRLNTLTNQIEAQQDQIDILAYQERSVPLLQVGAADAPVGTVKSSGYIKRADGSIKQWVTVQIADIGASLNNWRWTFPVPFKEGYTFSGENLADWAGQINGVPDGQGGLGYACNAILNAYGVALDSIGLGTRNTGINGTKSWFLIVVEGY